MKGHIWTDGRQVTHGWSGETEERIAEKKELMVNEADGRKENRNKVRKIRWRQNSEIKCKTYREM